MTSNPHLIPFDDLQQRLGDERLRLVDASWYLPAQNRNARSEYAATRLPRAVFFDQDAIVDPGNPLPHALPSAAQFASAVGELGIKEDHEIVVYDGPGHFTAPRVWWMFRLFGARSVKVLDGGFDRWKAEGRPVETGAPTAPERATFTPGPGIGKAVFLAGMKDIVAEGAIQIADARGPGRFEGSEPEPRAGMRSGHMPGARNVPFMTLTEGGLFKDTKGLRAVFEEAGIDPDKPVVTSCGSGVTAAVITLALASLGNNDTFLYDGSWSEWGGLADTPVETGPARR